MSYNVDKIDKISKSVLKYIEILELDKYPGGVPNTLYATGEQWDFPNVWPPMQYLLIKGLENLGTNESVELSTRWGHRWVKSNFQAYSETRTMFEKVSEVNILKTKTFLEYFENFSLIMLARKEYSLSLLRYKKIPNFR